MSSFSLILTIGNFQINVCGLVCFRYRSSEYSNLVLDMVYSRQKSEYIYLVQSRRISKYCRISQCLLVSHISREQIL